MARVVEARGPEESASRRGLVRCSRVGALVGLIGSAVLTGAAAPARAPRPSTPRFAATVVQSGHSGRVTSIAFTDDGRTIASGSYDRTVKLWDTTAGRERRTL